MPFRLWYYLAKIGGPALFATVAATFFAPDNSVWGQVRFVALCVWIPLCLAGAVMGVLMACGRLRMRCPFCGRRGEVGGSRQLGMWMVCEECGLVHGEGPLRLKLVRVAMEEEEE